MNDRCVYPYDDARVRNGPSPQKVLSAPLWFPPAKPLPDAAMADFQHRDWFCCSRIFPKWSHVLSLNVLLLRFTHVVARVSSSSRQLLGPSCGCAQRGWLPGVSSSEKGFWECLCIS